MRHVLNMWSEGCVVFFFPSRGRKAKSFTGTGVPTFALPIWAILVLDASAGYRGRSKRGKLLTPS
ncbi:hypothetical protein LEM9266_02198 [Leuconostoc mesenteroides]|nr:hypothetical protein LEM9266_02198 [Leuconostoc mesenteroides]